MIHLRTASKKAAAALALALVFAGIAALDPAQAQGDRELADLRARIERLQRDMTDLQLEVYRGGNPVWQREPGAPGAAAAPPAAAIGPYIQRVDDLEQSLRRLTGELEVLVHRLNEVSLRMDRMQNQIDYVEDRQNANPLAAGDLLGDGLAAGPEDASDGAALALAPPEAPLGTIPGAAALPTPDVPLAGGQAFAGGEPEAEFDAAMGLLTRAQYDRAGEAFRAYALAYPDTELGAQALYWTGDIAYSVAKDFEVSARDFAELLKQYPRDARAPEAMLKLGLSLLALGQKQEGCVTLAAFPRTYPNASETIATRARNERRDAGC